MLPATDLELSLPQTHSATFNRHKYRTRFRATDLLCSEPELVRVLIYKTYVSLWRENYSITMMMMMMMMM